MSEIFTLTFHGVRCSGHGCDARRECAPTDTCSGRDAFWAQAAADGWTLWTSRSRRAYCPECGPKPGHRMRQIRPKQAPRADDGRLAS